MATQIARIGSTVAVAIPEDLLRRANLAVGDPVEWTLTASGSLALHTPASLEEPVVEDGYEEWKLAEIEAGFAEIEAGRCVSGEKVLEWAQSLGTSRELKPPV
jgi:antitoxin component of MazEF toxin-antitoxin module